MSTFLWRSLALSLATLSALAASALFLNYAGKNGIGWLDLIRAAMVFLATAWIGWGAAQAFIGLVPARRRARGRTDDRLHSRTAILIPIYNENPAEVFARIGAMILGLRDAGLAAHFDFAILSDTTRDDIATQERTELAHLLRITGTRGHLFYRRRTENTGRKAGNIEAFITRSGGAYDFALILDADSLMEPATIAEMVRRMQAAPRLGLLQTLPRIVRAQSLFGRAMQFSAALYAPVFARGQARMQGVSGPFWGHNALIRVSAFAESCGLPVLRGKPPFGGHILSHDYVEAALLARAGWQVRVDTDLGGSYEEGPENLIAYARRDRRWCQGNLQHARLLLAPGLRLWNRFAFVQGIAAYTAPLLWGLFLLASVLAAATEAPVDYFPTPHLSVPIFPGDRTLAAIGLLAGVVGLLLLPKVLIALIATVSGRARGFDGNRQTGLGTLAEIALSSVIAPVIMMFQARAVAQILSGRDGGWPATARDDGQVGLAEAWAATWWMVLTGALTLGAAAWFAPDLVIWLCPVTLPLLIAPVLIAWTSRPTGPGLFATPETTAPPRCLTVAAGLAIRHDPAPDPIAA
ncbi:MAG: glucans biosynthesis glucosyltransferase MdoH [Qingshengfaniella sp.]